MNFQYGYTNAGNVALRDETGQKMCWVRKTGELVYHANFPDHILTQTVSADTPELAGQSAHEMCDINFCIENTLRQINAPETRCDDADAWNAQLKAITEFYDPLPTAMLERFKAEAAALTIGQLREKFTAHQFQNILYAARNRNNWWRHGDRIFADALGKKLRAGLDAKHRRREKWQVGRVTPCVPLAERLRQFKAEKARKKSATLAKRRAPLERLALHIARMWSFHKDRTFGSRGDGIAYGFNQANSGSKRRGGPGTRCSAGVRWHDGKIEFYPTHNRKPWSINAPPLALRKAAIPQRLHPLGLLCTASQDCPGVDINWDFVEQKWQPVGLSIRGVQVTEKIARREFTVADALAENNVEVRRIMLGLLPADAVVSSGALKEIHRDDFGVLYCDDASSWRGRNALMLVKVVNSTPEPDGTFKDYYLRVPPDMRTAKQAVAWTFGMSVEQYQPIAQS
ncbi:MAG: hypothetical protein KGL39_36905 [Patescibacteria group bacterium]|nr:hypothetical protein [Patescibacteria group bacterium]